MKLVKSAQVNEQSKNMLGQIHALDNDVTKLFQLSQGRIEFGTPTDGYRGENIYGRYQVFTTSATPDAENTVAHELGAIPSGVWIVMSQDKAGSLYKGSTTWTSTNAYFKCSVASVTFTVFILP